MRIPYGRKALLACFSIFWQDFYGFYYRYKFLVRRPCVLASPRLTLQRTTLTSTSFCSRISPLCSKPPGDMEKTISPINNSLQTRAHFQLRPPPGLCIIQVREPFFALTFCLFASFYIAWVLTQTWSKDRVITRLYNKVLPLEFPDIALKSFYNYIVNGKSMSALEVVS